MMEADEVTVVVHGARGLQGKKPGRHKYSVIFGVGTKKYRTSVVKDPSSNPDWNEESIVHVTNASDHVFFTVTEKDDVLGQIIIPVASLLTVKGVVKKSPLKAHKKCPNPHGELIFQCYISKQRPTMVTPQIRSGSTTNTGPQLTGFQKLRQNFSPTPNTLLRQKKEEKEEKRRSSSLANFNKKLSKSIHDIFHIGRFGGNNDQEEEEAPAKNKKFNLRFPSLGSGLEDTGREIPIVTHIVPNMASIHGGTRLVLEGRNLGLGKSDIMELLLCGSDLLDTIEFESDNRIYVTTKPTTAGKGDLWIETVSGGQNVIKNIFTFMDRSATTTPIPDKKASDTGSISSRGKNSALAESLAEKAPIPENDTASSQTSSTPIPSISVERSSSLNQDDRQKRRSSVPGSATLPRMHSTSGISEGDAASTGATDSPTGRFRKNYQKHTRTASESVVAMSKEAEARKTLKQENADMKTYIDGLVARVMIHCPEALAAGPDLKPLGSGT